MQIDGNNHVITHLGQISMCFGHIVLTAYVLLMLSQCPLSLNGKHTVVFFSTNATSSQQINYFIMI